MTERNYTVLVGQHTQDTDGTPDTEGTSKQKYIVADGDNFGLFSTIGTAAQATRQWQDIDQPTDDLEVHTPSEYGIQTVQTPTGDEYTVEDMSSSDYDEFLDALETGTEYDVLVGQHTWEADGTFDEEGTEKHQYVVTDGQNFGFFTTIENVAEATGQWLDTAQPAEERELGTPSDYGIETIEDPTGQEYTVEDMPEADYDELLDALETDI